MNQQWKVGSEAEAVARQQYAIPASNARKARESAEQAITIRFVVAGVVNALAIAGLINTETTQLSRWLIVSLGMGASLAYAISESVRAWRAKP